MNRIALLSLALVAVFGGGVDAARRNNHGKKMVCYVGTWAIYRPGDGKFQMEDIDPHLCTHAMYGFTKLLNNEITVFDPWGDDLDEYGGGLNMYRKFTGLKKQNRELKTLIAIGGWNEGSANYSDMARDPSSRRKFVKSIVPFLKKYDFDGLDLDWEYPTQRGGRPEDRENFSELVRELREELDRAGRGYLLTAAVSPNTKTVEIGYEVPEISRHLDFINVMCYDYHGFWDGHEFTGHNTPLYRHPLDDKYEPFFNANDTITYWLEAGLPKEKLVMGMALYGRGFKLENPQDHGLYAPTSGGLPQGPYTRQDGIWGYNEICEKYMTEMSDWRITIDDHVKAPYAYNGENWIGYEDVESLYYKAEYARNMGLAGAMVWSLETDDFRGKCHGEKFILTRTIANTINGGSMPTVPERPEVVPADAENEIPDNPPHEIVTNRPEKVTTKPTRPPRTARTTRPPGNGRPTPTRPRTTTAAPEYEEEDEYTTRRPTRRPRTTTTEDYIQETERTTRRPNPPPSGGSGQCQEEGMFPEGNCTGFYQCIRRGKGFQKVRQSCPAGTAYNPDIQTCDHADQVPGCSAYYRSANSYRPNGQI